MATISTAAVGILTQDELWTTAPTGSSSSSPKVSKNKLLTTQFILDEYSIAKMEMQPDEIKDALRKQLFDAMVKADDVIQFTQQYDPLKQQRVFRAYVYVADSQYTDLSKVQRSKPITAEQLHSQWKKYSPNQTLPADIMKIAKMVEEFHNIT